MLIKCWEFDYSQSRNGKHVGTHTDMIRQICTHENMKPVVQECRDRIKYCLEYQDIVKVVCVDEHGRHRSVAVAKILQAICAEQGYKTFGPHAREKHRWKENFCRDCEHCLDNEEKAQLYKRTATYWSE